MEAHDCNFHEGLRRCINDRCPLHRGMRTLGENIRIGAALCRAFFDGFAIAAGPRPLMWAPGCGRSAP